MYEISLLISMMIQLTKNFLQVEKNEPEKNSWRVAMFVFCKKINSSLGTLTIFCSISHFIRYLGSYLVKPDILMSVLSTLTDNRLSGSQVTATYYLILSAGDSKDWSRDFYRQIGRLITDSQSLSMHALSSLGKHTYEWGCEKKYIYCRFPIDTEARA